MLTEDRPMPAIPPELPATPLHKGNRYLKGPPPHDEEALKRENPTHYPTGAYEPPSFGEGPLREYDGYTEPAKQSAFDPVFQALASAANPKTLMGRKKLPVLSVIPAAAILREAEAMAYGAFEAPRADGGKGYGPYNWREKPIEYMTYIDATFRHCMQAVEGEDFDPDSKALHLAHARASLGILIDAIDNGTVIDDRPALKKSTPSRILKEAKEKRNAASL